MDAPGAQIGQQPRGGGRWGEHLLHRHLKAHALQAFGDGAARARGGVGEVADPQAPLLQAGQGCDSAGNRRLALVQHTFQIEQQAADHRGLGPSRAKRRRSLFCTVHGLSESMRNSASDQTSPAIGSRTNLKP